MNDKILSIFSRSIDFLVISLDFGTIYHGLCHKIIVLKTDNFEYLNKYLL